MRQHANQGGTIDMDGSTKRVGTVARRTFLKTCAASSGLWLVSATTGGLVRRVEAAGACRGPTLDPLSIPKYVRDLIVPPAMPLTRSITTPNGEPADYYEIAVRQFRQEIVPGKQTTVWSYLSLANPAGTQNYPAFTIEARYGTPVWVKWVNGLVDENGNFLPHLLPVDQTLHWANPAGGTGGRDGPGTARGPYRGPVPIVTHLHGAHTTDESDGYAEAWYLPPAKNIPAAFARTGTFYETFRRQFLDEHGADWQPGSSIFQYRNDQPATTLWYHDHVLGMTRLNVYAGPAGFYLLRGGPFDLPPGQLPSGRYEIPIVVQDRSFDAEVGNEASLFYPNSRRCFDDATDVPPIWNPEFFGNTMVVNGRTWPKLHVEPRRYRFRFLNGCNSRFVILKIVSRATQRPGVSVLPFWRIGAESGFLPKAVAQESMVISPAERADVIVDFTGCQGAQLFLINEGPDDPFPGEDVPFDFADPASTGQVMKFIVDVPLSASDTSLDPARLALPIPPPLASPSVHRRVALLEEAGKVGPRAALLGTVEGQGSTATPDARFWSDPITENPEVGATEIWALYNFTEDAHPIHLHQVQFQVLDRQQFLPTLGAVVAPKPWETGFKDTVTAFPGQITRIKAKFDLPGRFVWHCHILEHEDNEMMRPYTVGPDFAPIA
jgi:FtsP/CotA-like multicopper oxidase with cupredoxin domain